MDSISRPLGDAQRRTLPEVVIAMCRLMNLKGRFKLKSPARDVLLKPSRNVPMLFSGLRAMVMGINFGI